MSIEDLHQSGICAREIFKLAGQLILPLHAVKQVVAMPKDDDQDGRDPIPDHLLFSLSPLTWEHVNLTGDYLWDEKPALDENGFREIPFTP